MTNPTSPPKPSSRPVNVAIVDGSLHQKRGGWGVRLIVRGVPTDHRGRVTRPQSSAHCEITAILRAVELAPKGEALTVYTDADGMVDIVRKQRSNNATLQTLARTIAATAERRGVELSVHWKRREGKHQKAAHNLANAARTRSALLPGEQRVAAIIVTPAMTARKQTITLQRPSERITDEIDVPPGRAGDLPLEALISLAYMLRPGDRCDVLLNTPSPLTEAYLNGKLPTNRDTRARVQELRRMLDQKNARIQILPPGSADPLGGIS